MVFEGQAAIASVQQCYFNNQAKGSTDDWVGGGGQVLHLSGMLEKQTMSLSGERETPKGRILDRIQWTLLADGRVQQEWDLSTDGGQSWKKSFVGIYSRQ